jgi:hypothetical protein
MGPDRVQPDDVLSAPGPVLATSKPQWSRPRFGQVTGVVGLEHPMEGQPQWSRPRFGRVTRIRNKRGSFLVWRRNGAAEVRPVTPVTGRYLLAGQLPQWSGLGSAG